MPQSPRLPFVPLITLLERQFPELAEHAALIESGRVLVDKAPVFNTGARVRANASIRITRATPLRGTLKMSFALSRFAVDITDRVALDLGAAAGGFTVALLDAGARHVYALDAGVGQLRGTLRNDDRVTNLERTNLADLSSIAFSDPPSIVVMDLSYLSIADAIGQVPRRVLATDARLIALVKPTFELHSSSLARSPDDVDRACELARSAVTAAGWDVLDATTSPVRGTNGAVEAFLYAEVASRN